MDDNCQRPTDREKRTGKSGDAGEDNLLENGVNNEHHRQEQPNMQAHHKRDISTNNPKQIDDKQGPRSTETLGRDASLKGLQALVVRANKTRSKPQDNIIRIQYSDHADRTLTKRSEEIIRTD